MRTRSSAALLTLLTFLTGCSDTAQLDSPNVVLLIVDDLGWMDTGVYGSEFYDTPNVDRLAASGALFTQFYAASPVCSPTRVSIMTGKHPARLHLTNWIGGEQKGKLLPADYLRQLPLEEVTIAEAFKEAGYATAYVGKWHLGEEPYLPESQGFDVNIAGHGAGQPGSYFYPYVNERLPWSNVPGLEGGEQGEYLTDRLTDEALSFIADNRDRPFFLVLSHYAVHTPLQAKASIVSEYQEQSRRLADKDTPLFKPEGVAATTKTRQDHAVYAAMMRSTDESVGRVLGKLEELEIDRRTILVFTSDNGGLSTLSGTRTDMPTANLPLRAGKGWLYEGGIRVPLLVAWPGVIEPGIAVEEPTMSTDLYPTLLEMAGLKRRPEQHLDGISLAPLLESVRMLDRDREALFWHFPHYHGSGNTPSGAVRYADYKLVEWFETGDLELYDLARDIGESHNLVEEKADVARQLHMLLQRWRNEVDALMPTSNPDWDASREERQ
ncbi:MAG: sulfatase [Gemmatimonadota bacterium]|nr:MAG: sulfatase [Gemmatimonadota bacterium]